MSPEIATAMGILQKIINGEWVLSQVEIAGGVTTARFDSLTVPGQFWTLEPHLPKLLPPIGTKMRLGFVPIHPEPSKAGGST